MVREEGVSINEVKIALIWVWESLRQFLNNFGSIETKKIGQP